MTPARRRLVAFLELAIVAGGIFLAWSQPWFTVVIDGQPAELTGERVAAALVAIALTVLALIAAFALAGPVLRTILGVLSSLLGVIAAIIAVAGFTNPDRALEVLVAEETGLSGESAVAALARDLTATAWGPVAIAFGVLLVAVGIHLAVTARTWPAAGRKYSATRLATTRGDAVDDWDALTAGDDPTSADH